MVWGICISILANELMLDWSWLIGVVVFVFLADWGLRVVRDGR